MSFSVFRLYDDKIHWKQYYTETVSDKTLVHNETFQLFSETPNGMQAKIASSTLHDSYVQVGCEDSIAGAPCKVLLLEAVFLLAYNRRKTGCSSPILAIIGCGRRIHRACIKSADPGTISTWNTQASG